MTPIMKWLLTILALVNAATIAINAYNFHLNQRIAALNREITERLPPHPCGPVILPGESCGAVLWFRVPRDPGQSF